MSGSSSKKYEHFEQKVSGTIPVIAGTGKEGQKFLRGTVNKWIRLRRQPKESKNSYSKRVEIDKKKIDGYKSHLLIAKSFDTQTTRLVAIATKRKMIGYSWMPVLGDDPISFDRAKAVAVWLNSTLGRIALRRVTGRKIAWPQLNPVAFRGVPFINIDDPKVVSILSDSYDSTFNKEVSQFLEGRTRIRERWDDAVSQSLQIDRELIGSCADKLHVDPFVSKEMFFEHS